MSEICTREVNTFIKKQTYKQTKTLLLHFIKNTTAHLPIMLIQFNIVHHIEITSGSKHYHSCVVLKEKETLIFSVIVLIKSKTITLIYNNHACTTTVSEIRAA